MNALFNYIEGNSPVHRLTGATKLLSLILLSISSMITFDTRFLLFLALLSLFILRLSGIRLRQVRSIVVFTLFFMILNNLLIYLFSPENGCAIYGTRHVLFKGFGRWSVTEEQLFYQLNVILKYLSALPLVLIFVSTTDPGEFASSLSRIGVSYRVAYSVSLALRYIPDIQKEYRTISLSLQARGIEMDRRKQGLMKRLRTASSILFPLIISSMDRIEVISNAMMLRGFGKGRKRTWYTSRAAGKGDIIVIVLSFLLLLVPLFLNRLNGGRFYNPFI